MHVHNLGKTLDSSQCFCVTKKTHKIIRIITFLAVTGSNGVNLKCQECNSIETIKERGKKDEVNASKYSKNMGSILC